MQYLYAKVLGEPHEDRKLLQALHQNMRDYYVSNEQYRGQVALLCMDDLEKMPLDQLAYNGKRLTVGGADRLAPASNFEKGNDTRKLIFSTYLVLTTATKANQERLTGKRVKLERVHTQISQLPLSARQQHRAKKKNNKKRNNDNNHNYNDDDGENAKIESVQFAVTDRSGIPIVVIKNWATKNKEHIRFSQPSTALQHAEDLIQVVAAVTNQNAPEHYEPLKQLLGRDNNVTPYLILTSDGATEHSVRLLQNVLPLWEMLRVLDLDAIEKIHFCPGHSKDNPDEMLNRTVKRVLKGRYMQKGDGEQETMEKIKCAAGAQLTPKTHAGEQIHVFVAPTSSMRWWKDETERQRFEMNIEDDYDALLEYCKERKRATNKEHWLLADPPEHVIDKWRAEENGFDRLERLTKQVKAHLEYFHLYGVKLTKCARGKPPCEFCAAHPPRGNIIPKELPREWQAGDNCTCTDVQKSTCKHTLNNHYSNIRQQLNNLTPKDLKFPKRCGNCRYTGHTIRKCPDLPADHPAKNRPPKKPTKKRQKR
jgi:hypothetical protein